MTKILRTRDLYGITRWLPVTMAEWDTLSDHNREILVVDGSVVFVKRID